MIKIKNSSHFQFPNKCLSKTHPYCKLNVTLLLSFATGCEIKVFIVVVVVVVDVE
jgi:hypothetical protein